MQLKELTNNQKRKEFLEDYTGWNLWLYVPQVSEKYYLYPLPDNTMIVAKETEHTKGNIISLFNSSSNHIINYFFSCGCWLWCCGFPAD